MASRHAHWTGVLAVLAARGLADAAAAGGAGAFAVASGDRGLLVDALRYADGAGALAAVVRQCAASRAAAGPVADALLAAVGAARAVDAVAECPDLAGWLSEAGGAGAGFWKAVIGGV